MAWLPVMLSQVGISKSNLMRLEPIKTVALSAGSYTISRLLVHNEGSSLNEVSKPLLRRYSSQQMIEIITSTAAKIADFASEDAGISWLFYLLKKNENINTGEALKN
jgi:hypothetical protein